MPRPGESRTRSERSRPASTGSWFALYSRPRFSRVEGYRPPLSAFAPDNMQTWCPTGAVGPARVVPDTYRVFKYPIRRVSARDSWGASERREWFRRCGEWFRRCGEWFRRCGEWFHRCGERSFVQRARRFRSRCSTYCWKYVGGSRARLQAAASRWPASTSPDADGERVAGSVLAADDDVRTPAAGRRPRTSSSASNVLFEAYSTAHTPTSTSSRLPRRAESRARSERNGSVEILHI